MERKEKMSSSLNVTKCLKQLLMFDGAVTFSSLTIGRIPLGTGPFGNFLWRRRLHLYYARTLRDVKPVLREKDTI